MYKFKTNELLASEIAKYLNTAFTGPDIIVRRPADLGERCDNVISYYDGSNSSMVDELKNKMVVLTFPANIDANESVTFVHSTNPRRDYYRVITEFFVQRMAHRIDPSAHVHASAKVGYNVNIGRNSVVGESAIIGSDVYIGNNVSILGNVSIGTASVIKDGAVIGAEGFAFVDDEAELIHLPQFGSIDIGNQVWIGANTTIERPFFGATIIKTMVQIDDLCHVGQGSIICSGTQVAAGTLLSRSTKIGNDCSLGVGSMVREKVEIADDVIVGMGSVVVANLASNATYAGVPAKKIK